jgi:hypothetical protein
MAEIRHFRRPGFPAIRQNTAPKISPPNHALIEPCTDADAKLCVYNETRERFVAVDLEATDASHGNLEEKLRTIGQGATGLWILPYLEIPPNSIRLPLDLIFLDNNCVVSGTVASFPLAGLPDSIAKATSVLALPAETLARGEIRGGDQLLLSAPEEMKRHLQRINEAKAKTQDSPRQFLEQFARTPADERSEPAAEEPMQNVFVPVPAAPAEVVSAEAQAAPGEVACADEPAPAPQTDPWTKRSESRDWFTRLLFGDPVDPRKAPRETLPGLIAYFFTGGTPVGEPVREISATGMYLVTKERWYPGTVVRITLTDRHNPTTERSITVNAKAVRWGSDGVGLEFVLEGKNRRKSKAIGRDERTNGVDIAQVEGFLRNFKAEASCE